MNFTPKSEEEIKYSVLLSEGIYQFEVTNAIDDISKSSGNEQIKLTLQVWDYESGKHSMIFDYLLEKMAYKLRHFCSTTNLIQKYEAGSLKAIDCIGKKGMVEIKIQQDQQNPKGGYYPAKNVVKDYVQGKIISESTSMVKDNIFDADIPF